VISTQGSHPTAPPVARLRAQAGSCRRPRLGKSVPAPAPWKAHYTLGRNIRSARIAVCRAGPLPQSLAGLSLPRRVAQPSIAASSLCGNHGVSWSTGRSGDPAIEPELNHPPSIDSPPRSSNPRRPQRGALPPGDYTDPAIAPPRISISSAVTVDLGFFQPHRSRCRGKNCSASRNVDSLDGGFPGRSVARLSSRRSLPSRIVAVQLALPARLLDAVAALQRSSPGRS